MKDVGVVQAHDQNQVKKSVSLTPSTGCPDTPLVEAAGDVDDVSRDLFSEEPTVVHTTLDPSHCWNSQVPAMPEASTFDPTLARGAQALRKPAKFQQSMWELCEAQIIGMNIVCGHDDNGMERLDDLISPGQVKLAAARMVSLPDDRIVGISDAWSTLANNVNRPLRRKVAMTLLRIMTGPKELS